MLPAELITIIEQLFRQGYFKEIIELLTTELLQKYNNGDLYAWRAQTDLVLAETEDALFHINEAFRKGHNSINLNFIKAKISFQKKEYDKAVDYYTKALKLSGSNPYIYFNRGIAQHAIKEYDKAIDDFSETIRLDPTEGIAHFNRGIAWEAKKEYDKTLQDFSAAIQLGQKNPDIYIARGIVWYYKKEYDNAIADYYEALRLDHNCATAVHINLGLSWYEKKEYDKAIADYYEALRLDHNCATAVHINLGLSWYEKKEYDKAIADYSEAIRLNPTLAIAYFNRGKVWYVKEEFEKVIYDCSEAIQLNETYAYAYDVRGIAWHVQKEYDKALNDYFEAIRIDPMFADPHFHLYQLYSEINEVSLSFTNLNRATYLGLRKPFRLVEAYHQNFFAPLLLRRILNEIGAGKDFHTLLETYSENDRYCFNWEAVLIIAEKENSKKDFELSLLRLKALINYFMGDCIESYRIYDEDIDANNSYKLNLQDLYYYIRSAQGFLEDYNSNLKIALEQAKEDAGKSKEDAYYAGKLFLLSGKISEAENYFKQLAADGYRPGLYQLIGLYDSKQFYNREKRDKLLLVLDQLVDKEGEEIYLINGVEPLVLTNGANIVEVCYNFCKHFAIYEENTEEIQLVRNLLNINSPFKQNDFWELIKFEDDEFYRRKIENFELFDFEQLLFKAFHEYCKITGIESFRNIISRSNQASETEQSIDADILKNKNITYETALAKKISDMKRIDVFAKWFLVLSKLYYLEEKMTIKDAICLHMFAQQTAIRNRDQLNSENIHVEIQVWVRKIITLSSPLITKMLYRAFQFIQDGFVFESPVDDNIIEYENFKKQYNHHLAFWKNSLSVEFMKEKISH